MCFYYLLLGHMLGDFTFQTDTIACRKVSSYKWNALHSLIVTSCMLALSFRFGPCIAALTAAGGVLHFVIDSCKSKIKDRNSFESFILFLSDQIVHVSIIYLISIFPYKRISEDPGENSLLFFSLSLVFSVWFCGIFIQYVLRIFFPSCKRFYNGNEKTVGQIARLIFFAAIYASLKYSMLFAAVLLPMMLIEIYYYNRNMRHRIGSAYFSAAALLNIASPVLGMCLFYNINI